MAREIIRVHDEFYIRSSSPRVDVRTRALKQGDTFAVFDRFGDIETLGSGELGLYYQDTQVFVPADSKTRKRPAFAAELHGQRRQRRSGGGRNQRGCLARRRGDN